MNNKRYIDISSSYRNRNLFPNVGEFEVYLGVQKSNPETALDPIISGPTYLTWLGGQGTTGSSPYISQGTLLRNIGADGQIYLGQTGANPLQTLPYGNDINTQATILSNDPLYYNGYRITVNGTNSRIIKDYNVESGAVFAQSAFTNNLVSNDTYTISDPSNNLNVHVPTIDSYNIKNLNYAQCYNGYYIIDESLSNNNNIVSRKIISYDIDTQMATLNSAFPTGWSATDIYTLHKTLPSAKYLISSAISGSITLPSYLTFGTGHYNGQYIYDTGLMGTGSSSSSITGQQINSASTAKDSFYYISSYSGAPGNIASVSILPQTDHNKNTPQTNINSVSGQNDIVYISSFVNDNYTPLSFGGSSVSQNESVNYEVCLIDLCLPNVLLETGSRIAYYPFVYVQLTPMSSPSHMSNSILYSNNPNSNRALFMCSITDITAPYSSSFVRIDSGVQTQTIKTKPNDSFRFSVFLPDGRLFMPFESDTFAPFPTNGAIQISAEFSFKRLETTRP